ncbi:MAG: alpha/beta fold hydrolase [Candidatus Sericytochromatia bacterium]|nr:alpha/beta fold hydrolase [Candidatus Sericytochromatia bacterium]
MMSSTTLMPPLLKKMTEYKRQMVSRTTVVYQDNKVKVLKVVGKIDKTKSPVLMIPAMINKYYILDLSENNSLAKSLSDEGHAVYMIDWGEADPEDRWQTFTDVFLKVLKRVVSRVTRDAGEKPVLFGYCMGGAISAIYTSMFQDEIKGLIGLTVPIDFSKAGVMSKWTNKEHINPYLAVAAMGNMSPEMTQNSFISLKPAKFLKKWDTAWKKQDDDKFMDSFLILEQWVNENIPFPGGIWQEYITWLYQDNLFFKDELYVGNHKASLKNITCPILTIIANDDHIVPSESAEPLHNLAGSTNKTIKNFAGGHVGIIASPKLFPQLAETVKNWLEDNK